MARWGHGDLSDTVGLLVTEVLGNAVRYARSPVEVRMYLTADEVLVEVTDDCAQLPQRRLPEDDDEAGRGLLLVDALAADWGARPAETGKTVWFSLKAPA